MPQDPTQPRIRRRVDIPSAGTTAPAPTRRRVDVPAPAEDTDPVWGDYLGMLIRGASGFVGNAGGVVGAAAGGGGDLLAQMVEQLGGSRDGFNLGETAVAATTGLVPFGKAASLLSSAAKGALISGAAGGANQAINEYTDDEEGFNGGRVVNAAIPATVVGGLGGLGAGLIGSALGKARPAAVDAPPVRYDRHGNAVPRTRHNEAGWPIPPKYDTTPLPVTETRTPGNVQHVPGTRDDFAEVVPPPNPMDDIIGPADWTPEMAGPAARTVNVHRRNRMGSVQANAHANQVAAGMEGQRADAWDGYPNAPVSTPGSGPLPSLPVTQTGSRMRPVKDQPGLFETVPGAPPKWSPDDPLPTGDGSEDDLLKMLDRLGIDEQTAARVELDDPTLSRLNGSGESGASMEALSRQAGMGARGEQFGVYDATGQFRPLIGPDAVDYRVRPGETYGVQGPNGFRPLDDAGGRVPAPGAPTSTRLAPDLPDNSADAPFDLGGETIPARPARTPAMAALDQAAEPMTFVPREQAQAYRQITEREARALALGKGAPSMDTLLGSARRWQEEPDPSRLWGLERKATGAARARGAGKWMHPQRAKDAPAAPTAAPVEAPPPAAAATPDVPAAGTGNRLIDGLFGDDGGGGESGQIDPELLRRLGIHLGSAAGSSVGAGLLSDDENRGRNMIGAGIVGGALPFGAKTLGQARYFAMLSGLKTQLSNVSGGAGSTVTKAGELALTGDTEGARRLLSSVFSKDTIDSVIQSFKTNAGAEIGDTRWGQTSGVLGLPSRFMHSVDEGVTDSMRRGGLTKDEAQLQLFTSDPRSEVGNWIANRPGKALGSAIMPFVRTATNLVERGLEHTPGAGFIPAVARMRPDDTMGQRLARQGMGAAAMGAGAVFGEANPYVTPALGPLALPYAMGTAAKDTWDDGGDRFSGLTNAAINTLKRAAPLPTDGYSLDAGRYLSSYVPGIIRDANLDDVNSFRTSGKGSSVFDASIAKLPGLNRATLRRKVRRRVG